MYYCCCCLETDDYLSIFTCPSISRPLLEQTWIQDISRLITDLKILYDASAWHFPFWLAAHVTTWIIYGLTYKHQIIISLRAWLLQNSMVRKKSVLLFLMAICMSSFIRKSKCLTQGENCKTFMWLGQVPGDGAGHRVEKDSSSKSFNLKFGVPCVLDH